MKNIKDILIEKLIINKNSVSKDNKYHFVHKETNIDLYVKLPFYFFMPELEEKALIEKIEQHENEFGETVWAFYEYDKSVDNYWRVVTLSTMGIKNVFIRYLTSTIEPLIFYINGKHYGKRTQLELDNPKDTIIKSLDEKLMINKDSKKHEEIFWFTNNQGIKLPFELYINELHKFIKITKIEHIKPIKKDLWKLFDNKGNHIFTLYDLVLKTLFFNKSNHKTAILRIFDDELKTKVRNPDSVVVHYKDLYNKILQESIQESQDEPKKYSNMIVLNPNEDSVLILRRSKLCDKFRYKFGFPGGSIDSKDKNSKDAAIRELKEETGIELTWNEENKCKKYDTITNKDGSISEYYIVTLEEERDIKLSKEHTVYEWFNGDSKKNNHMWMPDVFQIIQKIL